MRRNTLQLRPPLICGLLFALLPLTLVAEYAGAAPVSDTRTPMQIVSANSSLLELPMERSVYFVGETIPLGDSLGADFDLLDERGQVVTRARGTTSAWKLDTTSLEPGNYTLRSGDIVRGNFVLVSPRRPSSGAFFDEVLPLINTQDPVKTAADKEVFNQAFKEAGIDAIIAAGTGDLGRYTDQDEWARYRTMIWLNPYTRPISFSGAQGDETELRNFTQRLALIAQANTRYPTFGGFDYQWDPLGYNRDYLLIYWQWGKYEPGLRAYIQRSEASIGVEFKKRTGLEPVTTSEFLCYCLATGHTDFAPVIDLPTARWLKEIGEKADPMTPAEVTAFESRLDVWVRYLSNVMGSANTYHSRWLKQVEPTLVNTSSHDSQFIPRQGSWQPPAYAPLDFRFIEAWNDQVDGPDYNYQWLFNAALTDMERRPGQPTWVGSTLALAHSAAPYPGRFCRAAAHNLAYGGRGLGVALEGFSNLVGGMNKETNWPNMRGGPGAEDVRSGREFLRRFAPLQEQSTPVRKVGVLYSLTQYGRQNNAPGYDTPLFNVFITLVRCGYTPRLVTEAEIEAGGLAGFSALVVVNQTATLPVEVNRKLQEFTARGGQLLESRNSTAKLPGATPLNIDEPYSRPGRPFNWSSPNSPDRHPSYLIEDRVKQLAPALRAALGNTSRSVLVPQGDEASRISTLSLDGGLDATYVVATNDSFNGNQSTWARQDVNLLPNSASRFTALYDLTDESALGHMAPVKAGFMDRTVRLYALLAKPVASVNLKATQRVRTGGQITTEVSFWGVGRQKLRAAIPFHLQLVSPAGISQEFYRCTDQTGQFGMQLPMGVNAAPGTWHLIVRSQLDGRTVTLPIEVTAGHAPPVLNSIADTVVVRGDLSAFWKANPEVQVPIFDGPDREARIAAAKLAQQALAAKGVMLDIVEAPAFSTYVMGYDPTAAELAENSRAENGEVFGKIERATINGNDWFATQSGYVYGKPLLLLDITTGKDDPLAEKVDDAGLLWPKVSAGFPGAGHATAQVLKSAFSLGKDALVVQAYDAAGLKAAAIALSNPPSDWISAGVEAARHTLTQEFSIGRQPEEAVGGSKNATMVKLDVALTSKGVTTAYAPEPLKLDLRADLPPLQSEVQPPTVPTRVITDLPALISVEKAALPYYQANGVWVRAWSPGPTWVGDLRFSDATFVKVNVPQAGRFSVSLQGLFRNWDRTPRTQANWEEIVNLYMTTVKPTRQPMEFDVLLDGKNVGQLSTLTTATKEVVTQSSTAEPRKATAMEEVVTSVSGELTLPQGEHELLFVPKYIVDGKLESIDILRK